MGFLREDYEQGKDDSPSNEEIILAHRFWRGSSPLWRVGSPQPPTQEVSTGILKEVSEKGHTAGVIEEDTYQTGHGAVECRSESPCTHFPYPHAFKMEAEYSTRERLP